MPNIEIRINGLPADFEEVEGFPVSIVKQMDKFVEIAGSTGSTTKNVIDSLVLPATKRNCEIVYQSWQPAVGNRSIRGQFSIVVVVNGAVIFSGRCILKKSVRRDSNPKSFSFDTLGDGLNIWEALEGISLRSLDCSTITLENFDIHNSNLSANAWPTFPCIFAPVIYGTTSGPASTTAPWTGLTWKLMDFRPSVYYAEIVTAIFTRLLGYQIESGFFATDFWKDWVYAFGVGSQWKLAALVSDCKFYAERTGTAFNIAAGGPTVIQLNTERYDPLNIYNNAVAYKAVIPYTGVWEFRWNFQATGNFPQLEFRVQDPSNPLDPIFGDFTYTRIPAGPPGDEEYYWKLKVRAGATVWLQAHAAGLGGTINIGAYLSGQLIDEVIEESEINLATCLHDKPVKDFIRAITHQFNLVWFVNNVTRTIFVEPRFDYYIHNNDPFTPAMVRYQGWYSSPSEVAVEPMALDADTIELEVIQPFGKFIRMQYKDDSDPLGEYYKGLHTASTGVAPYGVELQFEDRGEDGETSENPLFGPLFIGWTNTVQTYGYFLPWILPSGTDVQNDLMAAGYGPGGEPATIGVLPTPTFESGPKCAYVIREMIEVEWIGGIATDFALLMQHNSLANNYGFSNFNKWSGGYCSVERRFANGAAGAAGNQMAITGQTDAEPLPGLVEMFYWTYLATIKRGLMITGEADLTNVDVSQEDFRALKSVQVGPITRLCVLVKIDQFKPMVHENTKVQLIEYMKETEETFLNEDGTDAYTNNDEKDPQIIHFNPL